MKYIKPNFKREWEEAIRYPEFKKMGKEQWIHTANKNFEIINYNEIEDVLGNVDLDFENLNSEKRKRFEKSYSIGKVEIPIAVKFSEEDYDLLGGNTRLSGLLKKGKNPKIWVIDLSKTKDMAENLDRRIILRKANDDLEPIEIDIEKHFFDQAAKRGISEDDIVDFFDKLGDKKSVFVDFLRKHFEIVVKDKTTKLNVPFIAHNRSKKVNGATAKTIMGKDDFKTTNKIMTISENNRLMETFMYKFKNSDTDTKKLIVQKIVEYYNRF